MEFLGLDAAADDGYDCCCVVANDAFDGEQVQHQTTCSHYFDTVDQERNDLDQMAHWRSNHHHHFVIHDGWHMPEADTDGISAVALQTDTAGHRCNCCSYAADGKFDAVALEGETSSNNQMGQNSGRSHDPHYPDSQYYGDEVAHTGLQHLHGHD